MDINSNRTLTASILIFLENSQDNFDLIAALANIRGRIKIFQGDKNLKNRLADILKHKMNTTWIDEDTQNETQEILNQLFAVNTSSCVHGDAVSKIFPGQRI